mmetsp:Transcript_41056/g.46646  ORF Transcript_41056/g.46646 Transcript_41056/m.46646 type:complete len:280 (+) Transcript_41056:34-873(+)
MIPATAQLLLSFVVLLSTTNNIKALFLQQSLKSTTIKGIIFDMDGTLIQSCIDFADMRKRIYKVASEDLGRSVSDGDVIKLAPKLSLDGQKKADAIFADIEAKALRDMKLMPGMIELCKFLDNETTIKRAILTRNVFSSIDYMYENYMKQHNVTRFNPQIARDSLDKDGNILTAKPQPDAIHYICRECWNCSPSEVIMVGDSYKDDVVAGNRAGCGATILLKPKFDNNSGNDNESTLNERIPTFIITELSDLQPLLLKRYCTDDKFTTTTSKSIDISYY